MEIRVEDWAQGKAEAYLVDKCSHQTGWTGLIAVCLHAIGRRREEQQQLTNVL
jgi:hypothetical protein